MQAFENYWARNTWRFSLSDTFARLAVSAPRLVWCMAIVQSLLGLAAVAQWMATGDIGHLSFYGRQEGSVILISFAAVEYLMSIAAWHFFDRREPLRNAWFFFMIAAACRMAGLLVASFLSGFARPDLRPVGTLRAGLSQQGLRDLGLAIGGPISMAALASGLFVVLLLYKKADILRRLRRLDFVLLALAAVFLLSQAYALVRWLAALQGPVSVLKVASWLVDPLVGILLLEAILVRRSVLDMGGGLVGRCWGAYAAGIFLTLLGDAGTWVLNYGYVPWQFTYVTSYVWFLAGTAYALGPAYQIAAIARATYTVRAWVPAARRWGMCR